MKEKRTYRLKKNCFVGKAGDVVELSEGMDGTYWENKRTGSIGCPFIEFDLIEEIEGVAQ